MILSDDSVKSRGVVVGSRGNMDEQEQKQRQREYQKRWREKNKEHINNYQKKWAAENAERVKGYVKKRKKVPAAYRREEKRNWMRQWREKNPETNRENNAKWRAENKDKISLMKREYKQKNRERILARKKTYRAIKSGEIKRPNACSMCGKPGKIEAHHEDYSKQLNITWLCALCHGKTRRVEFIASQYQLVQP